MDIESRLSISFYKTIATISEPHKIYVVQNINTNRVYIKKILDVYNKNVYEYLKSHPIAHTPQIYEIYEENNTLTIIEEYISGDTIEYLLETNHTFSNDIIRNIILQLCVIVSEFHNSSPAIIHRDIKPSNIIISPSNEIYLLDFNAAKYQTDDKSEDTTLLGTKGYAAPEQYGFGVSTKQTDIYAIGMLLNTLVNGEFSPFAAANSEFSNIIEQCIKLNANERFKDVNKIVHLLNKNKELPISTTSNQRHWQKYLPPGFRSLSPLSMIFSSIGYLFIFWLCLTLEVKNTTPITLFIERMSCLMMFLSIIFCSANYLNVQSYFPPCKTKNKFLHFLAVILLDAIVFLSVMIIMMFLVLAFS